MAYMNGFDFLVLYGAGLLSALVGTFFAKKFVDNSLSYGIKSVIDFDPILVAYMRGGVKEVIKVGLIGLHKDAENPKKTGIEAVLQKKLHNKTRPSSRIYEDAAVLHEATQLCKNYEYELVREKLVFSEATQNVFKTLKYFYYALFLGVGTFRVITGLMNEKPVLYLVGLMTVALIFIAPATRLQKLTRRGKRYLEDLTLTYKQKLQDFSKKEKDNKNYTNETDNIDHTYSGSNHQPSHHDYRDDAIVLAGLFGASTLADSNPDYGFVEDEPKRNYDSTSNSPSDSGSTWNSADSGSSSSDNGGSSDGGGSGCGGCGGGCGGGD